MQRKKFIFKESEKMFVVHLYNNISYILFVELYRW